jgi:hypothetical protein
VTANDCSIIGDLISSKILLHRAGSIGSFKMFCIEKEVWFMSLKLKLSILLNLIISDFYRNLFNYFTSLNQITPSNHQNYIVILKRIFFLNPHINSNIPANLCKSINFRAKRTE